MKFCPECGTKLFEGAKFCPECGYKIASLNTTETIEETSSKETSSKEKVTSELYIYKVLNRLQEERGDIFVSPNIPSKRLTNAAKTIANDINPTMILGIIDTSFLKNGKEGVVFTGTKVYIQSTEIILEKIESSVLDSEVINNSGQKKTTQILKVFYKDGSSKIISQVSENDSLQILNDILNEIKDNVDVFESTNQIFKLSDLSDETISAYLKIVINYLKADDGIIDSSEYKELVSLMTRIKVSKELHIILQEYRFAEKDSLDFKQLTYILEEQIKKEHVSATVVNQSLFMDLLLTRKENLNKWKEDLVLQEIKEYLSISEEQIDFFVRKIKLDEEILHKRMDDKQINNNIKELAAIASGGGAAIGALALTGAVTGWGVGLTGGLLGLTFSTGGTALGVLAIAGTGIAAYKGVRHFAGVNESEKYGMRISALKEKITRMEAANVYIIEDINFLCTKLAMLSVKIKETNMLNNEIMEQLETYISFSQSVSKSGELVDAENNDTKRELYMAQLPEILDINKYNELVNSNVEKNKINDLILYVYDEDKDYELSDDCDNIIYESAINVLENIGYFDTTASAVAKTKSVAKQGKEKIRKALLG